MLMPESHLIPVFTADQRAHRLSLVNVTGTTEFIGSMGGIFPVVRITRGKQILQMSAASTLYTTLVRQAQGGRLLNTDFFVDLFFDLELHPRWVVRWGAGHTSQHLSDDVAHRILGINYVRDYYDFMGVFRLSPGQGFVYGGVVLNNNFKTTNDSQAFDLSGTPLLRLGFEHAPLKVGPYGRLFYAADVKFKGELGYRTTQNVQAGIRFTNPHGRAIRFAFNYAWGYDERGQFYTKKRDFAGVGFYLDF
jgi:hypothetical protein